MYSANARVEGEWWLQHSALNTQVLRYVVADPGQSHHWEATWSACHTHTHTPGKQFDMHTDG